MNSVQSVKMAAGEDPKIKFKIQTAMDPEKLKDKTEIVLKTDNKKKIMSLGDGQVKSKGWQLVRQYFWERVRMRKLRKLTSLTIF